MIHLTDHFSWEEAFHTLHRDIDNVTNDGTILDNIARTAVKMEKVRAILGRPISVSSWYRCQKLNIAVGGSKQSDHMLGSAVDFISPNSGTPLDICRILIKHKDLIGFKQLILEHTWVHISWASIPNVIPKLEVLSLLSAGGYAQGLTDKAGRALV